MRFRFLGSLCAFGLAMALPALSASPQSATPGVLIPDTIASAFPGAKPVWIAANVAVDTNGEIRSDAFETGEIAAIQNHVRVFRGKNRAAANADCIETLNGTGPELAVALATPDDLARNSLAIIEGDVVAGRQGFYLGLPGTLYAIRVADRLKDVGGVSSGSVVYLFVDEARIATAAGFLCAKPFAPADLIPHVGDKVLVFAVFDTADATHSILPADLNRTVVVQHGSHLAVPKSLQVLSPHTLKDVVFAIRSNGRINELPARWEVRLAFAR